jgi:hypothetical protein
MEKVSASDEKNDLFVLITSARMRTIAGGCIPMDRTVSAFLTPRAALEGLLADETLLIRTYVRRHELRGNVGVYEVLGHGP